MERVFDEAENCRTSRRGTSGAGTTLNSYRSRTHPAPSGSVAAEGSSTGSSAGTKAAALSALIKGKAELEETHQPQHKGPLFLRVIFRLQHLQFFRGAVNAPKAFRRDDPIPRERLFVACVVRPQDG